MRFWDMLMMDEVRDGDVACVVLGCCISIAEWLLLGPF